MQQMDKGCLTHVSLTHVSGAQLEPAAVSWLSAVVAYKGLNRYHSIIDCLRLMRSADFSLPLSQMRRFFMFYGKTGRPGAKQSEKVVW
jgi:hypothetical protein